MEKAKFQKGDEVFVWSIGMIATVVSVEGEQYKIKRADGKHDVVMGNGLEPIQKEGENIAE